MATHIYQVNLSDEAEQDTKTSEIKAEDFRVIGSAVVFYRHLMGDKTNTNLFKLEDISSIELKETVG